MPTPFGAICEMAPLMLTVPLIGAGHFSTQYDVSPDGRRIYFMDQMNERPSPSINILIGWRSLLN